MAVPFDIVNVLSVCLVIGIAGYVVGMWKLNFFSKRKIKFVPPFPFVGNVIPLVLKTRSFPDVLQDWYRKIKRHNYGGIYNFLVPIVIIKDPHLIKRVLVKDFEYFVNRHDTITQTTDPLLGKCLNNLKGREWKEMRSLLDPSFSPKMLKHMVGLVSQCGQHMARHLSERSDDATPALNMKELFTRFTSNVIASCAFGLECDSFRHPDHKFYKMVQTVHSITARPNMIYWRFLLSPRILQLLKLQRLPTQVHDYFKSLVRNAMNIRAIEDTERPDMIHLMMQLRQQTSEDDEERNGGSEETDFKRDMSVDDDLVAQSMFFILRGLDTTATLLCWTSHMLAAHPNVQERLCTEIKTVVGDGSSKITYEKLERMKYLDMVIFETLRLFPPTVVTERRCVKDYTINVTGSDPAFVVPKGQVVWIPIFPLHRDARHFHEPERFDPERFNDENRLKIKPFTYMPFGAGSRGCIGSEFAFLVAKVALVNLLLISTLKIVKKTKTGLRFDKEQLTLSLEKGFWLGVEQRIKEKA